MSYSEICGLKEGVMPDCIEELDNSHGVCPVIWSILCKEMTGSSNWMIPNNDWWSKWKDKTIAEYKRAVFMFTFDYSYVKRENFSRMAKDIRLWLENYPPHENRVNHWSKIAEIFESNPDYEGIGLYGTSIVDNPYTDYANDEEIPKKFEELFEIYDDLDSL